MEADRLGWRLVCGHQREPERDSLLCMSRLVSEDVVGTLQYLSPELAGMFLSMQATAGAQFLFTFERGHAARSIRTSPTTAGRGSGPAARKGGHIELQLIRDDLFLSCPVVHVIIFHFIILYYAILLYYTIL